jgi:acetyltransferase-like isoleucine patch superfamily enzyme
MIHQLADVQTDNIGVGTKIWQYSVVLKGASIGMNCNINCHTFIENDVRIGNNVTVKSGVYLWDGIEIQDGVFIGPNVTFVNDSFPKSKRYPRRFEKILLEEGCSIGAHATILGQITVGAHALVGAGSVVTKHVEPFALVVGNPARRVGWVNEYGEKLVQADGFWKDPGGQLFQETAEGLQKVQ